MVFRVLAVTLAAFSAIIGNAIGDLPIPGLKEKYKINTVTINGTPNEYFSFTSVSPNSDHFSCTAIAHIIKTFPKDVVLRVVLKYQGQDIPPIEFFVCDGMKDPLFVNDVVSKGYPKETFPKECPIQPGNYTVKNWNWPVEKIPPGTPPGPVIVNVYLTVESTGEVIFHLYSEAEVVLDTSDVPKIPLGK